MQLNARMYLKPSRVAHICNPSPWEAEAGDLEFKVSLVYTARPIVSNK
jgi:hypothetical protein